LTDSEINKVSLILSYLSLTHSCNCNQFIRREIRFFSTL